MLKFNGHTPHHLQEYPEIPEELILSQNVVETGEGDLLYELFLVDDSAEIFQELDPGQPCVMIDKVDGIPAYYLPVDFLL